MRIEYPPSSRASVGHRAFTLVEVVVASAILAVGLAGILLICSNGLKAARVLNRVPMDAGSLAAMLSLSNQLEVVEAGTNGLYQANFRVFSASDPTGSGSELSVFLYRPGSVQRVGR
jgi:prepilin-type N-terminal cleavage/methylation domain-containing protein